jgi:hypothetical protein
MSSDSTGEIFVITKEDGSGIADVGDAEGSEEGASPTGSGSAPVPSETTGSAMRWGVGSGGYWAAGVAVVGALV